jgi:hypothetical protein
VGLAGPTSTGTYLIPVPLGIWSDEVKIDLGIVCMENELKLHLRVTLCTDPLCCIEFQNV